MQISLSFRQNIIEATVVQSFHFLNMPFPAFAIGVVRQTNLCAIETKTRFFDVNLMCFRCFRKGVNGDEVEKYKPLKCKLSAPTRSQNESVCFIN